MNVIDAIHARRTHKEFTARPVSREEIATLLDAVVLAPNHKMTEPWRFVVFGPQARERVAMIRARLKYGPPSEGEERRRAEKRAASIEKSRAIPAIVAVAMRLDDDPVRREEDYAATFMGIQNMLLLAASRGLGTKISTGAVLEDDELRTLLDAGDGERVVALIHIGEPAEAREAKRRVPAAERTSWLD
jgi:nitroreductase